MAVSVPVFPVSEERKIKAGGFEPQPSAQKLNALHMIYQPLHTCGSGASRYPVGSPIFMKPQILYC